MPNISLAEIVREELNKPLSESNLYTITWPYAPMQSVSFWDEAIYESVKYI